MAEPDNFEEDLFADLYEEEIAPKPEAQNFAVKSVAPAEPVDKEEEPGQGEQNGNGDRDEDMYKGEQDEDDEIDFNLGGNGYDAQASHEQHGPGIKEDG